jgi:hypothetical protein
VPRALAISAAPAGLRAAGGAVQRVLGGGRGESRTRSGYRTEKEGESGGRVPRTGWADSVRALMNRVELQWTHWMNWAHKSGRTR